MLLEATLDPAEKSSSSSLREQGPEQTAPSHSYSSLTAQLEKERAGQNSRIKCMYKVGWEALTSTPIPMVTLTFLCIEPSQGLQVTTAFCCLPAQTKFHPKFSGLFYLFQLSDTHSKKEMFSCTEDNSISAITRKNLESAHYHSKYIMSCNITPS